MKIHQFLLVSDDAFPDRKNTLSSICREFDGAIMAQAAG
ncbi:hypothetical protein L581_2454 [Serratia fonticola AU-AP2C]|nr:hypothetical protein L581_2454 [Serratia fonticola AU-AP2C]